MMKRDWRGMYEDFMCYIRYTILPMLALVTAAYVVGLLVREM